MPKSGLSAADEPAPAAPASAALGVSYKAKRCRYCKQWSTSLCPWNLDNTVLRAWSPLLPWNRGTLQKPLGETCKVCMIAARWSKGVFYFTLLFFKLLKFLNLILYLISIILYFLNKFYFITIVNYKRSRSVQVFSQGGFAAQYQTEEKFQKAVQSNPTILHNFMASWAALISQDLGY